ncbi:hypothetical protein DFA_06329 [Cavenderia fasciculata]|uniref:RRM domain-containing protein n=1 Tax=Cavenderia fasciculata TaxID=261658 RepID=F4PKQ8_CACFS|nr:uncharacterized protein DFA_06329 [Cavenderia fasciculata]EGG24182.1 hypothetical protein DFA_06329 [Cavenderia fasciculata]|eukprot:XP_004362033.1 hypothetical protein DFA_06329 [Cavenderia fasciculata]
MNQTLKENSQRSLVVGNDQFNEVGIDIQIPSYMETFHILVAREQARRLGDINQKQVNTRLLLLPSTKPKREYDHHLSFDYLVIFHDPQVEHVFNQFVPPIIGDYPTGPKKINVDAMTEIEINKKEMFSKKYKDVFEQEEGDSKSNGNKKQDNYDDYEFDEDELMKDSSDDDDDDDDDSSDDDDDHHQDKDGVHIQSTENVEHLEIKLRENQYNFDLHIEYIDALKKAKLLDRLREARFAAQRLFPLPLSVWVSWLSDEQQLSSPLQEQEKIDLFEKAINDYLSINVWVQYCKFIENQVISNLGGDIKSGEDERLKRVRDMYERAVIACSDHMVDSFKLWNTYRTFEQQVLAMIPTEATEDIKTKQLARIRSIYQRQLSCPQMNLEQTYQDYEQWEQSQVNSSSSSSSSAAATNIQTRYQLALKVIEDRKDYEKAVVDAKTTGEGGSTLEKWQEYIGFEKKDQSKKLNRIAILYERALQENYFVFDLWKQYLGFLEHDFKAPSATIFSVLERASRNVYWSGDIWSIYMSRLEKYSDKDDMILKVDQVFERALVAGLSGPTEYQHIFSTRFDILWRHQKKEGGAGAPLLDEEKVNMFEQHFQKEYEVLVSLGMDVSESLMFRAKFEAYQLDNSTLADQTFQLLYAGAPHLYHLVDEYIRFKITKQKDIDGAREIYKKAVKTIAETSRIWQDWLNFERVYGTLQTSDHATHVYQDTVQRYQAKQQKEFEKQKLQQAQQRKALEDKKRKKEEKQEGGKALGAGDGRGSLKKKKIEKTTIYISGLPFSAHSNDLVKMINERVGDLKEVHLVSDKNGKSKGIAFAEFNTSDAAQKCIDTLHGDITFNEKHPINVTYSKKEFKQQSEQEKNTQLHFEQEQKRLAQIEINFENSEGKTVFINNLSSNVTKEKLQSFIESNGATVSDVRVIVKARPFAYVDLPTPEQVQNALKLNNKYFLGNYMRVALSKPPPGSAPREHKPNPNKTEIVANPFDSKPGDEEMTTSTTSTTTAVPTRKPVLFIPRGLKKAPATSNK